MAGWAAAVSAVSGVISQWQANKAAGKQGEANAASADNIAGIFEGFGDDTLGIVEDLLGIADNVAGIDNPRTPRAGAFADEAGDLLTQGNRLATDLAQENRRVAVGEGNLESFAQLKGDALKISNFDFSPIPRDILNQLDRSALSRGDTGLAGLSERLAFDQKLRLADFGENRFFRALGFDTTFVPGTLSADNLFERSNQLATFEQNENQRIFQNELNRETLASGIFGAAANTTFNVESTRAQGLSQAEQLRAGANPSAIALAGQSALASSVGQGVSGIFEAYSANQQREEDRAFQRETLAVISRNNNASTAQVAGALT